MTGITGRAGKAASIWVNPATLMRDYAKVLVEKLGPGVSISSRICRLVQKDMAELRGKTDAPEEVKVDIEDLQRRHRVLLRIRKDCIQLLTGVLTELTDTAAKWGLDGTFAATPKIIGKLLTTPSLKIQGENLSEETLSEEHRQVFIQLLEANYERRAIEQQLLAAEKAKYCGSENGN